MKIATNLLFLFLFSTLFSSSYKSPKDLQDVYASIAERTMPSVVTIHLLKYSSNTFQRNGVGSGFIISQDGFIVTNYHVISEADAIAVQLNNKKVYLGKVIGTHRGTDIAIVKISTGKRLPYLKFADTRKVKVGHYAIAIGSPFALSRTMTTGIVSQKGRSLGLHYQEDYIQTDAAIHPGNSGGPLLNIDGKVIGINDCMISQSQGLGFAIDSNLAQRIIWMIIRSKSAERPWAGFIMLEHPMKDTQPIVSRINEKSPAASANMQKDDLILQIDDRKVSTVNDVQAIVLTHYNVGDTAIFYCLRKGKKIALKIKFEKNSNK